MKTFKKFGFTFAAVAMSTMLVMLLCLGFTKGAIAAVEANTTQPAVASDAKDITESLMMLPNATIEAVTVNKQSYKAGEEISGTFTATNHSNFLLSAASFRVLIGAEYDEVGTEKITQNFLDASSLSALGDLKAGETRVVPFKYKIPAFVSGQKLAAEIQVYSENSIMLGFSSSAYISIEKVSSSISVTDPKLILGDGKEYNLGEGPTIYKDKSPKTAALSIKVKNVSKGDIVVTPSLSVFNQQKPLVKIQPTVPAVQLKAGETKVVSIELPVMEYTPGVYFAEIVFTDAAGTQLSSRIGVRYIVGGDIATVHSVSADKASLAVGEEFSLNFAVSGRPNDVASLNQLTSADAKDSSAAASKNKGHIKIELFNEKGEQVAAFDDAFELYGDTYKSASLSAEAGAKALRATIQISNEKGEVFLNKDIELNADFDTIVQRELLRQKLLNGGIALLIIILIIIIILLLRKKKVSSGVLGMFVFVAIILPAVANALVYGGVDTGRTDNLAVNMYGNVVNLAPNVSISTPAMNGVYTEGLQTNGLTSAYHLSGSMQYLTCANTIGIANLTYIENITGASGTLRLGGHPQNPNSEAVWWPNPTFLTTVSYADILGKVKPGAHRLNFIGQNIGSSHTARQYGYVPYTVVCAAGHAPDANGYCAATVNGTVNGVCGSANNGTYSSSTQIPASWFCESGTVANAGPSNLSNGSTGYGWQCAGASGGTTTSCRYSYTSTINNNNGSSTGSTNTGSSSCGTKNNSPIANGQSITAATANLCTSGSTIYGNPTVGLDSSSWRWVCMAGTASSFCSASCASGTLYCPATGTCSSDCVDWCPDSVPGNPVGNQTERGLYQIDSSGLCSGANLIEDYSLNPSLTDSSGTCKALWRLSTVTDVSKMVCKINGTPVSCTNTTGYGVQPGTAKLEVSVTEGASSISDSEELRCTRNPNVIER